MITKVVIIGSGNVAWQLAHSLPLLGVCVVQIFSRNEHHAQNLAMEVGADYTADYNEIDAEADFYIYAVSDDALPEVIESVKTDEGIHIHTSGSVGISVFADKKSKYGVMYPLQTFTRNRKIKLENTAFFIEANDATTLDQVEKFTKRISLKTFNFDSEQRRKIHLAGVFANNFTNAMWSVSDSLIKEQNLMFRDVLLPLVEESIEKLKYMTPAMAQTGPAIRDDQTTINKHIEILSNKPETQH